MIIANSLKYALLKFSNKIKKIIDDKFIIINKAKLYKYKFLIFCSLYRKGDNNKSKIKKKTEKIIIVFL
jgi:hypothetical protein